MDLLYPNFRRHSTYYIQKIEKPSGYKKIFRKDYGVSDKEKNEILDVFDIPSMGAAEYESDKFGRAYKNFKENNKKYVSRKVNFLNKDYFLIVHEDFSDFYISMHIASEGNQKSYIKLIDGSCSEAYLVYDAYSETKDWMFFSDKSLFLDVCDFLNIKSDFIVHKNPSKLESFIEEIYSLTEENVYSFLKRNRIKKIDNSIMSKWSTLDFFYFYNKEVYYFLLKDVSLFSFKNKDANLFLNYHFGSKIESHMMNIKLVEEINNFSNLFPDNKVSDEVLDYFLSLCIDEKKKTEFIDKQISLFLEKDEKKQNMNILEKIIILNYTEIKYKLSTQNIKRLIQKIFHMNLWTWDEEQEEYYREYIKALVNLIYRLSKKNIHEINRYIKSCFSKKSREEHKTINKIYAIFLEKIKIEENRIKFKESLS